MSLASARPAVFRRVSQTLPFIGPGLAVAILLVILLLLVKESRAFFAHVSVWDFLSGSTWSPFIAPESFGVLPLVAATLWTSAIALVIGIPLALCGAVYVTQFASPFERFLIQPLIEIVAGIPSVVHGFVAVTVVTPTLQRIFPEMEYFNALSGGLVLGIMILPTFLSLALEALKAVPNSVRDAGLSLGASVSQVSWGVMVPAAKSGLVAAGLLSLARAMGETMAMTLAVGSSPKLSANPLVAMQTLTSYIAQISFGDTPQGGIEYQSLFAVALVLFSITMILNGLARTVFRQRGSA